MGIPTVRDRVAQAAAKIVLEPIFEADFLPVLVWVSAEAVGHGRRWSDCASVSSRGSAHVVEFDIANFFGEIDHDRLLAEVGRRVSDRRVLKLLRKLGCRQEYWSMGCMSGRSRALRRAG